MSTKIFIDGEAGTTGLQIRERLLGRDDLTLLEIDPDKRKDTDERRRLLNASDIAILCLPDAAARDSVQLIENESTRVIDASSAHRTSDGWTYGLPEIGPGQADAIRQAHRASNPGCWPQGAIAGLRPLVEAGLIPPALPVTVHGVSGYTGGGRSMIAEYEDAGTAPGEYTPYGLTLDHKHMPELQRYSGLTMNERQAPSFRKGFERTSARQSRYDEGAARSDALAEIGPRHLPRGLIVTEPDATRKFVRTLKLRVKDKHVPELNRQARAVNFTFNFINELSERSIRERGTFLSAYDLQFYTNGAGKELGLHSHTVQEVGARYVQARRQFGKRKLSWRRSGGTRRSLGWVPFKIGAAKWVGGQVRFNGRCYGMWDSYGLAGYSLRSGSFSEDSRGRWYFNVAVEVEAMPSAGTSAVGIDLGCKEAATPSRGKPLVGRWYRAEEARLAKAQQARKKRQVRAIHARIRARRSEDMHQFSAGLVRDHGAIFVGNVNAKAMAKTNMAKSVSDAGWSSLKTMLEYKCASAGIVYSEVDEAYSTQTCSSCGVIPDSSPKGLAGLNERMWTCSECGDVHHRDINAARNICARGLSGLAGGAYE